MDVLWMILIGIAAGWLGSRLMGSGNGGILWYIVVGVIGAILGGWLFGILGFATVTLIGRLISATIGAMILIALLRALRRNTR